MSASQQVAQSNLTGSIDTAELRSERRSFLRLLQRIVRNG